MQGGTRTLALPVLAHTEHVEAKVYRFPEVAHYVRQGFQRVSTSNVRTIWNILISNRRWLRGTWAYLSV